MYDLARQAVEELLVDWPEPFLVDEERDRLLCRYHAHAPKLLALAIKKCLIVLPIEGALVHM